MRIFNTEQEDLQTPGHALFRHPFARKYSTSLAILCGFVEHLNMVVMVKIPEIVNQKASFVEFNCSYFGE